MCLIVFSWDVHPKYKLIMAANRDEFYSRPTATASFWEDHPEILGGRDLQARGSWMTISKKGRVAAVTNYRDLTNVNPNATSRGEIPVNFITGLHTPLAFVKELDHRHEQYNGFNTLIGDYDSLFHYSNYERKINKLEKGIHGLSNALLNTPWPKVERAKRQFQEITSDSFSHQDLVNMMGDTVEAEDTALPATGLPYPLEKALSAMCIRTEKYGTCSTSVFTIDRGGKAQFTEKSYVKRRANGTALKEAVDNNLVYFEFDIQK